MASCTPKSTHRLLNSINKFTEVNSLAIIYHFIQHFPGMYIAGIMTMTTSGHIMVPISKSLSHIFIILVSG